MMKPDFYTHLQSLAEAAEKNRRVINLTPSENRLSPCAQLPLRSDFYNRYFFNEEGKDDFWEFRGAEDLWQFERDVVLKTLGRLARADHVNARPISGLSAMAMVVSALGGEIGRPVAYLGRPSGGHFATSSLLNRFGHPGLAIGLVGGDLDFAGSYGAIKSGEVALVYLDLQNFTRRPAVDLWVKQIREVSAGVVIHYDASHPLGLILGGAYPNPLDQGADSFGGSTHKTFPGPQKGVLFTRRKDIADLWTKAQYDLISSHHFAETISLGLAALEFEVYGPRYVEQMLKNAQFLSSLLAANGHAVVNQDGERTESHQVWVDLGSNYATSTTTSALSLSGIRVNVQSNLPGTDGQVLRLGTNEITFEGAGQEAVNRLATILDSVFKSKAPVMNADREVRSLYGAPYYYTQCAEGWGRL